MIMIMIMIVVLVKFEYISPSGKNPTADGMFSFPWGSFIVIR